MDQELVPRTIHAPGDSALAERLMTVYAGLHKHYGYEPSWWPVFGPLREWEIMLGALLVQQSRWERVEVAILQLLATDQYGYVALARMRPDDLAPLLVGVAYPKQKAGRVINLARFVLDTCNGEVAAWLKQPTDVLRAALLAQPGIGQETADAILLYAGEHTVFVVDAYLRRLFSRLGVLAGCATMPYEQLRQRIEAALLSVECPPWPHLQGSQARFFMDYHALLTEHAIHHCLARRPHCDATSVPRRAFAPVDKCSEHCPPCDGCPLRSGCHAYGQPLFVHL